MGIRHNTCKDENNHKGSFLGSHVHFSMEMPHGNSNLTKFLALKKRLPKEPPGSSLLKWTLQKRFPQKKFAPSNTADKVSRPLTREGTASLAFLKTLFENHLKSTPEPNFCKTKFL